MRLRQSLCLLLGLLATLTATVLAAAPFPPPELTGTWWQGEVQAVAESGVAQGEPRLVEVSITIAADGKVSGKVGTAVLQQCQLQANRGWLGRLLNLKTDYIVRGGYLEGPVWPGDVVTKRSFTIPFNLREGELVGTVMVLQSWRYPHPLTHQLHLKKALN